MFILILAFYAIYNTRFSWTFFDVQHFWFLTKIPHRFWRRITSRPNNPLNWEKLIPYHGELWISDADATANLDSHEVILYYQSRGYKCLSHEGILKQLLAGHDIVVLRKS